MFDVFRCAQCRRSLRVREHYRGRSVLCPGCSATLTVPPAPAPPALSDSCARQKVHPVGVLSAPRPSAGRAVTPGRTALPWLLLAPAFPGLGMPLLADAGAWWAGLGVGLAALCLVLGQRSRWPLLARVGVPLSLAMLGYGLALASPLLEAQYTPPPPLLPAHLPTGPMPVVHPAQMNRPGLPPLTLPLGSPASLLRQGEQGMTSRRGGPYGIDLQFVTRIGEFLAVAVAPDAPEGGAVLSATAAGDLRQHSFPDFQPRATYRLPQPAARLVLDGRRGYLYAAPCVPGTLPAGPGAGRPSAGSDLQLYDIRDLLRGSLPPGTNLRPVRHFPLHGSVIELLFSPDRRWVYYLSESAGRLRIGRLDADRQAPDVERSLPPEIRALCLSPDGKTLYAAGRGSLVLLDSQTLQIQRRLRVGADARDVAADNAGRVYLAEQGQWTDLTIVETRGDGIREQKWKIGLHGRLHLKLAPDQYRLYVGTDSIVSDRINALLVRGHSWEVPPLVGIAADSSGGVRGEFVLTPDGRFLLTRWGTVLRLIQGGFGKPRGGLAFAGG